MEEDKLKREIEELRMKMELEAERLGLNHQRVLEISQKIDLLHTKLIIIQKNKEKQNKETTYIQKRTKNDFIKENYNFVFKNIA